MPQYQINIYCHSDEFSEEWCDYIKSLLKFGKIGKNINLCTCNTKKSSSDFETFLKNSGVFIVLLTDSMIKFLGNEGLQLLDDLQKQNGIVGILCYADRAEFDNITSRNVWTLFEATDNATDNKNMIGNVLDLLEKKSVISKQRRRTKVRQNITVIPTEIRKPNQPVAIIFHKEEVGRVEVTIGKDEKRIEAKQLNKYTCSVKLPMTESGMTKLNVYNNGEQIGRHPLLFVPPNRKDYSCPNFLCQMFGLAVDDKDGLDEELVKLYEKTAPEDESLNSLLGAYPLSKRQGKSDAELPTLLHFAASNGLSQFCTLLLDTPGSLAAFQVENRDGCDPADLAEKSGHTQLAEFLRVFVETEATVQACDEIYMEMKGISLYNNFVQHTDDDSDYKNESLVFDVKKDTPGNRSSEPLPSPKDFMFSEHHSRTLSGSTSQDELIELAQGVKDGDFNIQEAERLYESWKQRNHTPSKSIKDRHAELKKIQATYTSVFEMVNKENKKKGRKSIMEKMKSKLGRKKSQPNIHISKPIQELPSLEKPTAAENRYSSSSVSSRDSSGSHQAIAEYGSESDDLIEEDLEPNVTGRVSGASLVNRRSFREDFLRSFENNESSVAPELPPRNAPPIPPRKY